MKPILLKMAEFGPYRCKQTPNGYEPTIIDFRQFGCKGIVLITGDTGAGKTTIFDAISFVFYGEPSGKCRKRNTLRSQNAPENSPTYVELTFSYQNTEYTVFRQMTYKSQRLTTKSWLRCGGKTLAEGDNVTKMIISIIGLTRDQFARIMMIAQGEFLQILMASTTTRQDNMRELFHTERYAALAKELRNRHETCEKEKEKEEEQMKRYVGNIHFPEGEDFAEKAAALRENRLTSDEQLALIESILEADTSEKAEVEDQIRTEEANKEKADRNLQTALKTAENYEQLQQELAKSERLQQELAELKQAQELAEAEQPRIQPYRDEAAKLEQQMQGYDEVQRSAEEIQKLESEASSKQTACAKAVTDAENAKALLVSMQEEQNALHDARTELQGVLHQQEDLKKEITAFQKLKDTYETVCNLQDDLKQAQGDHETAKQAFEAAQAACDGYAQRIASLTVALRTFEGIDGETERLRIALRDAEQHETAVHDVSDTLAECAAAEQALAEQEERCIACADTEKAAEQALTQAKESLDTYEQQSRELSDCETVRYQVQSKQEKLAEHQKKLSALHSNYAAYQSQYARMELAQKAFQDAEAGFDAADKTYNAAFKHFLENQAGLIASGLHAGDTCPVCGNVFIAFPQQAQAQVITEEELSAFEMQKNEASEELRLRSTEAQSEGKLVREQEQQLSQNAEELLGCTLEKLPAALAQAQTQAEQDAGQLAKEMQDAQARVELASRLVQKIEQAKKASAAAQKALDTAKEQRAEAEKEKGSLTGKWEEKSKQAQERFCEVIGQMLPDAAAQCREALLQAQQETSEARNALHAQEKRLKELDDTKQQLEQAQQSKKTADEILCREQTAEQNARDTVKELEGTVRSQEQSFRADMAAQFGEVPAEQTDAMLNEEQKRLDEGQAALKQAEAAARQRCDRLDELGRGIPAQTEICEKAAFHAEALAKELEALKAKLQTKQEALDKKREELPYPQREQAEQKMQSFREEAQRLADAIENAKRNCADAEQKLHTLQGGIEKLRQDIENAPRIDLVRAQEDKRQIEERLTASNQRRDALNDRIISNRFQLEEVTVIISSLRRKEKELDIITPLFQAANGTSGKKKDKDKVAMTLETYVLAGYLDKILVFANQRLSTMTNGHYRMRRAQNQRFGGGRDGLEINVIDTWAGDAERAVSSLSGGEGFMASMALALGFAEVIQHSAGGIQLDSMFIDEGFGSLDTDTLAQSMRVLGDLSNGDRLIGMISHVPDLKSRIDKQIIVRKDHNGASSLEFQT